MIGGKVKTKYLENYQTIVKGIKMARTETRTQVPFQNNEWSAAVLPLNTHLSYLGMLSNFDRRVLLELISVVNVVS